jgi:outer membrane assembly lipoprotein YfiO
MTVDVRRLSAVLAAVLIMAVAGQTFAAVNFKRRIDCGKLVHKAIAKYNKRHYNEAKSILTDVKYQCSGHPAMDTLLYYLGLADVRLKTTQEARIEFERLIQEYPQSPYNEEAHYLLGYCSYVESNPAERDQVKTHTAIRDLTEFIDRYPESVWADSAQKYIGACMDKLAKKEFINARFYQKIEEYDAAIVYYREMIGQFPQSGLVNDAKLSIAECLIQVSRPTEAKAVIEELLSNEPGQQLGRQANELLDRINRPERWTKRPLKAPKVAVPAEAPATVAPAPQTQPQTQPVQAQPSAPVGQADTAGDKLSPSAQPQDTSAAPSGQLPVDSSAAKP